jgi:membrane-associated phospholipid phosphatase
MPDGLMEQITDFGDSAILLPVAGLVMGALWLSGARRSATAWGVAVGLCCLAIVALKIALRPCDRALIADSLRNPSGHAAFAAVVYGCLALLLAQRCASPLLRGAIAGLASAWILVIGLSRLAVHAHTPAEVAVGLAIGAAAVGLFALQQRRLALPRLSLPVIGLLLVIVLAVMHGSQAEAEGMIRRLAWLIYDHAGLCRAAVPA